MMSGIHKIISLWAAMICVLLLAGASQAIAKAGDEQAMMRSVREHIMKNMLWPADNVRIEFLWDAPKLDDIKGKVTFHVESKSKEEFIGDTYFTIRVYADKSFVREETVRVRIEVLQDCVMSVNSISKDSIVQAEDVKVQGKWLRSIPFQSVSSLDDVVGKKITVSVRPNTQLTRVMLKGVMPVRKGKMVQVLLDNGVMTMILKGLAEEDGAEDSVVRIRNLSSNKIIYARVIGPGKVQVDF